MTWLTSDPWTWPDVTGVVVDHLTDALAAARPEAVVGTRIPDPRPAELVRVQRAGGVRSGVWDSARMQVECSAPEEEDAAGLVAVVREVLRTMPLDSDPVTATREVTGPTLLSDPVDATCTYLLAVEVRVRALPGQPQS